MSTAEQTRVDIRIPKEQKDFFLQAAEIGQFRNLTEFVVYSVQVQAETIIKKHEAILASDADRNIFFHAVMNPAAPGQRLKKAAKKYKELASRK
jgi:uncharacterized protein (DUF1778 family)